MSQRTHGTFDGARRRSRRSIVTALLTTGLVLTVEPVSADGRGQPELLKRLCVEQGGAFSKDGPIRTCTTVMTATVLGPVVTATLTRRGRVGLGCRQDCVGPIETLIAESQRSEEVEVTTVRWAKGNGPVSTTTSERTLTSTRVPLTCSFSPSEGVPPAPTALSACAFWNLFTA